MAALLPCHGRLASADGHLQLTLNAPPPSSLPPPCAQGQRVPLPSLDGTRAVTEAGQRVDLYSPSKQAPGRVQTVGEAPDSYEVLATAAQPSCNVTLLQIGGVLEGPQLGQ